MLRRTINAPVRKSELIELILLEREFCQEGFGCYIECGSFVPYVVALVGEEL